MIRKIYNYLKLILSIYFVYFFIDYSISNKEKIQNLIVSSLTTIFIIFLIKILIIFLNSLIFKKILAFLGTEISFLKAHELTVLNNLGNFIGPLKLGSGMRIEYLRQNYKINIKDFILKSFIFSLYTQIIFFITFIFALYLTSKINGIIFLLALIGLIMALITLRAKSLFNIVNVFSLRGLMESKLLNLSIFFLFFFGVLVVFLEVNLIFNTSYSLLNSVFIFQGISLSNLVNLTPANLGVREYALTTISSLHKLSLSQLIEIGLIDRFCSISATFVCFLYQNILKLRK